MTLKEAIEGKEYQVVDVQTGDDELQSFLFTLGCYSGESITVVAHRRKSCTVAIKDGRYNIDSNLAQAIIVQDIE